MFDSPYYQVIRAFVFIMQTCDRIAFDSMPMRPTLKYSRRSKVLHWDFLSLTPSHEDLRYVFVLKDDLTHFCELFVCSSPTAFVAAESILDWHKRFGSPESLWHSLSQLSVGHTLQLVEKQAELNAHVQACEPDVLSVLRMFLMQYQLDTKEWICLLPVVETNRNHTQLPSLGDKAHVEHFTRLLTSSASDVIWNPHRSHHGEQVDVDLSKPVFAKRADELQHSLQQMYKEVMSMGAVTSSKWPLRKELRATFRKVISFCCLVWMLRDREINSWSAGSGRSEWFRNSCILSLLITCPLRYTRFAFEVLRIFKLRDYGGNGTHVSNQDLLLNVGQLCDARYNGKLSRWKLEVSWQGLEEAENSYEGRAELFNVVMAKVLAARPTAFAPSLLFYKLKQGL
ncbi:LOW QUALITY PROTEIN: hypothetical protein PHMEG_00024923 [Phytophthora megakarya]|uniref:Uncharacterized protein n=1 Tax=Phytophthora megakarya TaxID=4795 RepID=A0A225VCD0_9STRA|nr:LOW QUALITY PROTEIN: hypothetical protein PHMEG_00024923 [Phytophthora megakarya]